jgi:hypothetical protein
MLACAACGRRLVGDGGRYRHLELCPEFSAAVSQARRRRPGQHRIPLGASYPAATYEAAVSAVLERVAVGADVAVQVVENLVGTPADPDRLVLARLERERRAAADHFVRDRDQQRLAATMSRLDAEEADARAVPPRRKIEAGEAREFLENLASLWRQAPSSRRQLAEAMFERIEVLGLRRIRFVPTSHAIAAGLAEAFVAGAGGWSEPGRSGAHSNRLLIELMPGIRTRVEVALPGGLRLVRSA